MQELPAPVTTTDHYLRAIYKRQGDILEELRSQRPVPVDVEQTVELTEPKRPGRPRKEG